MNMEVAVVGLVLIIVLIVVFMTLGPRWAAAARTQFPPMRKLNVPCSPDGQAEALGLLARSRIRFIPPVVPDPDLSESNFEADRPRICFVLISEEDYGRAKQIMDDFERKWFC